MKNKYLRISVAMFAVIFASGLIAGFTVKAKEGPSRRNAMARVLVFESLSEQEKKELIELRKTDKEKFRAVLKDKLVAKKAELEQLKKNDPEKFKAIMAGARAKIKARLAELKKNNPQKYEELTAKRRERIKARLEYLKQNDPQKYEELKKKIQERRAPRSTENNL
ncbi:MAG: hypothetical protein PHP17_01680 [Candidatus Omnitrophica bacterium]|nr:hypothetical protein [Candidatus Omnitrophota bacterium]